MNHLSPPNLICVWLLLLLYTLLIVTGGGGGLVGDHEVGPGSSPLPSHCARC